MTIEELKAGVPKHSRGLISQKVVDVFNNLEGEEGEDFAEHYKQNFITLSRVLKGGEYRISDYISAVKFVSYKLLENTDIDSYMMTFPNRYARLLLKYENVGTEEEIRAKSISPFVSAYKKNDLVAKLTEQALVPARILNAPMFQDALNVNYDLMYNARSEIVQQKAADSLLVHLAQPEIQKIELEVGVKGQDEIGAMREEMRRLAGLQQGAIVAGSNTPLQIAESKLMHEIIDVEDE